MSSCVLIALTACGESKQDGKLREEVRRYCNQLPATYELRISQVREGKYRPVYEFWLGSDAASNLHRKFDLCLAAARFSESERQEIFDAYYKRVLDDIQAPLAELVVENPTAHVETMQQKLIAHLEQARALAERVAAATDKRLR